MLIKFVYKILFMLLSMISLIIPWMLVSIIDLDPVAAALLNIPGIVIFLWIISYWQFAEHQWKMHKKFSDKIYPLNQDQQ